MKYKLILFFVLALLIFGCKHEAAKTTPKWSTLTITSEDYEVITINNTDDTSIIKSYDKGSIVTGWHKAKVDSLRVYFTMAEKDTLYNLAEDIISNPPKPKKACTDFVGDLKLVIECGAYKEPGSLTQSVEYSGVCEWNTLSDKTSQLRSLLKRKIKWPHGE